MRCRTYTTYTTAPSQACVYMLPRLAQAVEELHGHRQNAGSHLSGVHDYGGGATSMFPNDRKHPLHFDLFLMLHCRSAAMGYPCIKSTGATAGDMHLLATLPALILYVYR